MLELGLEGASDVWKDRAMRLGAILGVGGALLLGAGCGSELELGGPSLLDAAGLDDAGLSGDAGDLSDASGVGGNSGGDLVHADAAPIGEDGNDLGTELCLHLAVAGFDRSDDVWGDEQPLSGFPGYEGELLLHEDELLARTNAHIWAAETEAVMLLETDEEESFSDVRFADLNGDGQDEAIGIGQKVNIFSVESDGWHRAVTLPAPDLANGIAAASADFDEDGNIDILTLSGAGHVLYLGDGLLGFSNVTVSLESPLNNIHVYAAHAADVDGDEHVDAVFYATMSVYMQGDEHDASLFVLQGNGDGTFSAAIRSRLPGPDLNGVGEVLADFTGDGVLDAVFQMHDTTYLAAGRGAGRFDVALPILQGVNTPSFDRSLIAVADITADGLADLAVPDDQAVQVLVATGDGQFAPPEVIAIADGYLASVALQGGDTPRLFALTAIDSCSFE